MISKFEENYGTLISKRSTVSHFHHTKCIQSSPGSPTVRPTPSMLVRMTDSVFVISSSEFPVGFCAPCFAFTEIGKKAWLFAKLQPVRTRKIINVT